MYNFRVEIVVLAIDVVTERSVMFQILQSRLSQIFCLIFC